MSDSYVAKLGNGFSPNSDESVYKNIFQEFEHVIVESLITSFGLDFIVKDQHGGDVDTIHNVRQIGKDKDMTYKNKANQKAYENHVGNEPYSYIHIREDGNGLCKNPEDDYHRRNDKYSQIIKTTRQNAVNGVIEDAYTGGNIAFTKAVPADKKASLDHVLSAKSIYMKIVGGYCQD